MPGVATRAQALHQAHALVAEAVDAHGLPHARVLDLGCGVGGALAYLTMRQTTRRTTSVRAFGVTISAAQARLSRVAAPAALIIEADFEALPFDRAIDVAFAIESFAHAPQPRRFFTAAAHALKPGGKLIVIDDTLARTAHDASETRLIGDFCAGWRAPSLLPLDALVAHAAAAGMTAHAVRDLTPFLRSRALPDALGRLVLTGLRPLTRVAELSASFGSIALQQLYARGLTRYRLMEFARDR
jgi:SAM-dependent methyltransferase